MPKFRGSYTKEELRHASDTVMKSMNTINKRALSFAPEITNSLGQSGISKSAVRRRNRKRKANLAGSSMEQLLETLPEPKPAPKPDHEPRTKSQRAQSKAARRDAAQHQKTLGLSLQEIKERLKSEDAMQ